MKKIDLYITCSQLVAIAFLAFGCKAHRGSQIKDFGTPGKNGPTSDYLTQDDRLISENKRIWMSPPELKLCAAIRGNGQQVMSHFHAMAGIVEKVGLVEGVSGGSSATFTTFLYESMLLNPAVWNCNGSRCDTETARKRVAFLLKSMSGVVDVLASDKNVKALLEKAGGGDSSEEDADPPSHAEELADTFIKYGYQAALTQEAPKSRKLFNGRWFLHRLKERIKAKIHKKVWDAAAEKFNELLMTPGADLVNRKILAEIGGELIDLPPQKRWEMKRASESFDFNASDASLLFRNGPLDFQQLAVTIGIFGDFYAQRAKDGIYDFSRLNGLVAHCAERHQTKTWYELEAAETNEPNGGCVNGFRGLFAEFFQKVQSEYFFRGNAHPLAFTGTPDETLSYSRLRDPTGGALRSLVSISVLTGKAVQKVAEGQQIYDDLYNLNCNRQPQNCIREPAIGSFDSAFSGRNGWVARLGNALKQGFKLDFDTDVKFGYWGRRSDQLKIRNGFGLPAYDLAEGAPVEKGKMGDVDKKSSKFLGLGTTLWYYALVMSPAEPGLSKVIPFFDGTKMDHAEIEGYSAGGWSDLHPSLVLKEMGCQNVVYITREAPQDNEYGEGLAKIFNISDTGREELFGNSKGSSFVRSLEKSDAILCTRWNDIKINDFAGMASDAFNAEVYHTKNSLFDGKVKPLIGQRTGCQPFAH